ncbi:MAG: phytanoyl-CoA dioxygenase family protein [Gammaproteobacteria bacterium]|nr:phytanoyl-CoA dioxygenase family protein [Gammaproteobacteria bacterium]
MPENGETAWQAYRREGLKRAAWLGNRGPLRFDEDGILTQDILDAYRRTGFYVFTGVLSPEECRELEREFDRVLDNAPLVNDGEADRHGRPSRFSRHYSVEPPWSSNADEDSEAEGAPGIVRMLSHPLMIMDSALRAYGHPDILKMIASVNGPDFVPFSESVFHKAAYEGFPTRWHQDGRTHWAEDGTPLEQPDGSGKTHGVNLSVSWSHCTPENGLWVIPGSHRRWRLADGGNFPPITEWLRRNVAGICGQSWWRRIGSSSIGVLGSDELEAQRCEAIKDAAVPCRECKGVQVSRPVDQVEVTCQQDSMTRWVNVANEGAKVRNGTMSHRVRVAHRPTCGSARMRFLPTGVERYGNERQTFARQDVRSGNRPRRAHDKFV